MDTKPENGGGVVFETKGPSAAAYVSYWTSRFEQNTPLSEYDVNRAMQDLYARVSNLESLTTDNFKWACERLDGLSERIDTVNEANESDYLSLCDSIGDLRSTLRAVVTDLDNTFLSRTYRKLKSLRVHVTWKKED